MPFVLHVEVHALHRREVRVHQHRVDGQRLRLALLGGLVAAPALDAHFHLEAAVLVEGGERHVGGQDLHVGIRLEVPRGHRPHPLRLQADQLRSVHVQREHELAQVQDDIEGVLAHAD